MMSEREREGQKRGDLVNQPFKVFKQSKGN